MRFVREADGHSSHARMLEQLKRHDKQLIASTATRRFPNRKQFRFFFRFLTRREFLIWTAATLVFGIGLFWWLMNYRSAHRIVTPAAGGTYREAIVGNVRFINPLFASTNEADNDLTRLIFSGLMRYNAAGALVTDLAQSLTMNTSSTEYTAVLKDALRWHDGTELTADDVLFTIERAKDPTVGSPLRLSFQSVDVKKIDDKTIRFTLNKPFAAFPHALTLGILPRHIWDGVSATGMKLADANLRPVGAGPFAFSTFSKNKNGAIMSYTLERNETFHREKPFIKTIEFQFAPDMATAIDSYVSKRVDGIHFLPKENKPQLTRRATTIHAIAMPQYTALFFNEKRNSALEKITVRKALAYAINKEQIIRDALKGDATAVSGPLTPGEVGFRDGEDPYAYNPTKSIQLLDSAGFAPITRDEFIALRVGALKKEWKSASDGSAAPPEDELTRLATEQVMAEIPPSQQLFRKNKINAVLTVTLTIVNNPEAIKVAETVQSFWQAIGVHTLLRVAESSVMNSDILKPRNFEALLFGEILGAASDPYPFWHSSQIEHPGLNISLYINRKADTLLEDARQTTDQEKRAQKYTQFQELLDKDLPAIFLYSPKYLYIQRTKINATPITRLVTPADRFNAVETWYIKKNADWN